MTTVIVNISPLAFDEVRNKMKAAGCEILEGYGLNMNGVILMPQLLVTDQVQTPKRPPLPDMTTSERNNLMEDFGIIRKDKP